MEQKEDLGMPFAGYPATAPIIPSKNNSVDLAMLCFDPASYCYLADYEVGSIGDSPLETVLKRERFTCLSEEAKQVVDIILSSPIEILNTFGRITKQSIRNYLRGLEWSWKKIGNTEQELKEFIKTF